MTKENIDSNVGLLKKENKSKKFSFKLILIFLGLVMLIACIFILKNFYGPKDPKDFVFYEKDKRLYFYDMSADKSIALSEEQNNYIYTNYDIQLSSDSKFFIYPTDPDDKGNFSLYKKSTQPLFNKKTKIDDSVVFFKLSNDNKHLIYLKDKDLYDYNISKKSKELIQQNISANILIKNNADIIYITNDNKLFYKPLGKDSEMLSDDVHKFWLLADTSNNIIFNDSKFRLYEVSPSNKKVFIADNVQDFVSNRNSSYYYFVNKDLKIDHPYENNSLMDLYYKEFSKEKILVAKDIDPRQSGLFMDDTNVIFLRTSEDYYKKYIDNSNFRLAKDTYKDKESNRSNSVNRNIGTGTEKTNPYEFDDTEFIVKSSVNSSMYDLYGFDGQKFTKICSSYNSLMSLDNDRKGIILVPKENIKKIKLEAFKDKSLKEIDNILKDNLMEFKFLKNDKLMDVENFADPCDFNSIGIMFGSSKDVYYYCTGDGDLYQINLDGEKLRAELYNKNVSGSGYITKNGDIFYVKDVDKYSEFGNLYKNKKLIDKNVNFTSLTLDDSEEKLFYIKDSLSESSNRTLMYYKNGEILPISDNVLEGQLYNGKYYYLTDFNKKTGKASLKVFIDEGAESLYIKDKNSKPQKISNKLFIYTVDQNIDDIISPNLYFSGFRSNNKSQSH
ncbi:hypothetical protein [Peptoniphilus raoultii]|uniref:hypothetical protein n=1 Tax=Peptoniphilus raoultii TaxID=1776387 RepID=UPI0008D989F9|nr:hypothetical protein [Peptoniphilus raoultii]